MDGLVIGDVHLTGCGDDISVPQSWRSYDVIFTVGDVVDHRNPNPRSVGRTFYRHLNALEVPVFAVPGNHDFEVHGELTSGFENVCSTHMESRTLGDLHVVGVGSERFVEGPRVLQKGIFEPEVERLVEEAILEYDGSNIGNSVEKFDIDEEKFEPLKRQLSKCQEKYRDVQELLAESGEKRTILLTHVAPFDTSLDKLPEHVRGKGGRHWGSIITKLIIKHSNLELVLCGHFHENEGYCNVSGTLCVNPGYRNVVEIQESPSEGGTEISNAEELNVSRS